MRAQPKQSTTKLPRKRSGEFPREERAQRRPPSGVDPRVEEDVTPDPPAYAQRASAKEEGSLIGVETSKKSRYTFVAPRSGKKPSASPEKKKR